MLSDIATTGFNCVIKVNPKPSGGTSNMVDFTILLNRQPEVDGGSPYPVDEVGSVRVVASGSDPEGDSITYQWNLDNDGIFEIDGSNATFSTANLGEPSTYTIVARVPNSFGLESALVKRRLM